MVIAGRSVDLTTLFIKRGKKDTMHGMLSILLLSRNKFDMFNNTAANMFRFYSSYDTKNNLVFSVKSRDVGQLYTALLQM